MSPSAEVVRDQLVALLPRLRRFARALARSTHDADDLVQVSVERALLHLDQPRPGTRLESWMLGIIRDTWIDETHSHGRRDERLTPEEPGEQEADSPRETPPQRLSIEAALERLPAEQRLAVALVLVEGLAYKEAAAALGVPTATVTSRLARGRETLEALLGGREGGAP
jgi:RNA polymerase sigma-70 factor (ECF subfamily)